MSPAPTPPASAACVVQAKCHPNAHRATDESDRIMSRLDPKPSAKYGFTQRHKQKEKQSYFQRLLVTPSRGRRYRPENHNRSEDEIARHISQPPGHPRRTVLGPIDETCQRQARHADCRTNNGARDGRESKPENIL